MSDFFDVVGRQRAHREFAADDVDDATVERLLWAATRAPSAENTQPWQFVVVRDEELRARLADLTRRAWEGGGREYSRPRLEDGVFEDVDHGMTSGFATAPLWIVVGADTTEVHESALGSSVFPAVQNLLLAATAEGLGSALTTISLTFGGEVRDLLGLPPHVRAMAAVPLGHPARELGPSRREPVADHAHVDRFGRAVAVGVRQRASRWGLISLGLAVVASLVVLLAPLGTVEVIAQSGNRTERVSLLDEEGADVILLFAIPVAFAAFGALGARTRAARFATGFSAVLLVLWILATLSLIGLAWLPAAGAMIAAAVQVRRA